MCVTDLGSITDKPPSVRSSPSPPDNNLTSNIGRLVPLDVCVQVNTVKKDPLAFSNDWNRPLPNQFSHAPQGPSKVMGSFGKAVEAFRQGISNPLCLPYLLISNAIYFALAHSLTVQTCSSSIQAHLWIFSALEYKQPDSR